MRFLLMLIFALSSFFSSLSQTLSAGFDVDEYRRLMLVSAQFGDSAYRRNLPAPSGYQHLYRSPEMGLKNMWDLWLTAEGIPVINIRGTTSSEVSWLANFYAAMVPARGQLQLTNAKTFAYNLAADSQAAVHVGWLVATGFLSESILQKIDSLYKTGKRDFLIVGHSQGGAIAYLLTAYLSYLQKDGKLSPDIRFKTYCSAAPKPGNVFFAYDYEAVTRGGWAWNVVNAADWVPQTPFSVQTISDMNTVNPFVNAKAVIKNQPFLKRLALKYAYGKLTRNSNKASKHYTTYLGRYAAKAVRKQLPEFVFPAYVKSNDYVRTGNTISLMPSQDYYRSYPQSDTNVFVNHLHTAYLFLLKEIK